MRTAGQDFESTEIFVSHITSIDYLIREYPNQKVIPHFEKLQFRYPYYRPIRGDGNCFYRAIAFIYLRQASFSHFSNVFENIENVCEGYRIEFEGETFEQRLHWVYEKILVPIQNTKVAERQQRLAQFFNRSFVFDTMMILYFRSLNYHYIKRNRTKFKNYICEQSQVEMIKVFGRDSEGVEYDSMAKALNIEIVVQVVDQTGWKPYIYNQGAPVSYDLFFRPGHYDVLYHENSPYLISQYSPQTNHYSPPRINQPPSYFRQDHRTQQRISQAYSKPRSQIRESAQQNNHHLTSSQQRWKSKISNLSSFQQSSKLSPFDQKSFYKALEDPLKSMGNLRQDKLSTFQQKQKIKQKPKEQIMQTKPIIRVEVFKAWQKQTSVSSEPLKKIKEFLILVLFLAGLGFVVFKL